MKSNPLSFESFNARNLAPEQVANTFVASLQFNELTRQNHTIILGPRGSGKTTLLKMLQPEALDAWQGEEADEYRQRIGFTGVFIATDVSWGEQVSILGLGGLDDDERRLLSTATFTTQIFRRLVDVMSYIMSKRIEFQLDQAREAILAGELAKIFKLDGIFYSMLAVRNELSRRLIDMRVFASMEAMGGSRPGQSGVRSEEMFHLSFLHCCIAAIEVFNDLVRRPQHRWALLFDELELAPASIRDFLIQALRSVDERLIFKLSLVPAGDYVSKFSSVLSSQPGHDYDVVSLWYAHKDQAWEFCRSLWGSLLRSHGLVPAKPEDVLGRSISDTQASDWTDESTAYRPGTRAYNLIERLSRKDSSFAAYLKRAGIRLSELSELSGNQRAGAIRKVMPIVALRDAFIKSSDDIPVLRSRKALDIYTGADALFAITEGNPRVFKAIVSPLLSKLDSLAPVSATAQAKEIRLAMSRFRALLRAFPVRHADVTAPQRGLITILDAIGEYFFHRLVIEPFNPDPPGSFTVDARTSDELLAILGDAMNLGAIVCLSDLAGESQSLRGRRFRLSYLLAPYYKTSLRIEREVALSTILNPRGSKRNRSLFLEDNNASED